MKILWFTKSRRAQSTNDYETWKEGGVVPTLNAFDQGDVRATTIIFYGNRVQDLRVQGEVINTLQARMGTGGNNMPMVATFKRKAMLEEDWHQSDIDNTLRSGRVPEDLAVTYDEVEAFDEYNNNTDKIHHTLRAGTKQSTAVITNSNVRRLTPIECERLQGFPDDWTSSQSDTHRYKQMGNAVTVNVIEWIGQQMRKSEENNGTA